MDAVRNFITAQGGSIRVVLAEPIVVQGYTPFSFHIHPPLAACSH